MSVYSERPCTTHVPHFVWFWWLVVELQMNSVARCKNGFVARTMCIYCETVLWSSFVETHLSEPWLDTVVFFNCFANLRVMACSSLVWFVVPSCHIWRHSRRGYYYRRSKHYRHLVNVNMFVVTDKAFLTSGSATKHTSGWSAMLNK